MRRQFTSIQEIEIFSRWVGFADPPSVTEKLTIRACGDHFRREVSVDGHCDELSAQVVQDFVTALGRASLPDLSPDLFDFPLDALHFHFGSGWTDDYPSLLVRVTNLGGHVVDVRSDSQHAFMLPLKIIDQAAGSIEETFDPRLSKSIAALMTETFLNRTRLCGQGCMFESDIARAHEFKNSEMSKSDDSDIPPTLGTETAQDREPEDLEAAIHRILSREESPDEKADAERTGNHSQRLLKRISLDELDALIKQGVNPNVSDGCGQTALMLAAFPPFNRERFQRLVEAGADLEARRDDGVTGLHLACAGWMTETAAAWIAAGANVNAVTPEGATPLMLGAACDGIVELLLKCHVAVNAVDHEGHSALAYAILKQSSGPATRVLNSIRALLVAGADVNLNDQLGLSPIDHALRVQARAKLDAETIQAFSDSLTKDERVQRLAEQERHSQWLEQHRRDHPEDESLIDPNYDDQTLAAAIVELVTAASRRSPLV